MSYCLLQTSILVFEQLQFNIICFVTFFALNLELLLKNLVLLREIVKLFL